MIHDRYLYRSIDPYLSFYDIYRSMISIDDVIESGKEWKLLAELQAAVNQPQSCLYIDSSFYNGFSQRYDRQHYIELVAHTIRTQYPALHARVDAMLPIQDIDMDDDESWKRTADHTDTTVAPYPEIAPSPR